MTSRILQMINRQGFVSLFWEQVRSEGLTYKEVFEAMNNEYKEATGSYRYLNYDSFKRTSLAKDRRLKQA